MRITNDLHVSISTSLHKNVTFSSRVHRLWDSNIHALAQTTLTITVGCTRKQIHAFTSIALECVTKKLAHVLEQTRILRSMHQCSVRANEPRQTCEKNPEHPVFEDHTTHVLVPLRMDACTTPIFNAPTRELRCCHRSFATAKIVSAGERPDTAQQHHDASTNSVLHRRENN